MFSLQHSDWCFSLRFMWKRRCLLLTRLWSLLMDKKHKKCILMSDFTQMHRTVKTSIWKSFLISRYWLLTVPHTDLLINSSFCATPRCHVCVQSKAASLDLSIEPSKPIMLLRRRWHRSLVFSTAWCQGPLALSMFDFHLEWKYLAPVVRYVGFFHCTWSKQRRK